MAAIVLGYFSNYICALKKNKLCGVKEAVESLYNMYIVWLYRERREEREKLFVLLLLLETVF